MNSGCGNLFLPGPVGIARRCSGVIAAPNADARSFDSFVD
jgi:hypothetical protein